MKTSLETVYDIIEAMVGSGMPEQQKGTGYYWREYLAEKWRAPEAFPWEYQGTIILTFL